MITDEIHGGLTGSADSVHLSSWPDPEQFPSDPELVASMDRIRHVVSTALRLREDEGLRVRLPLPLLTIAGRDTEDLAPLLDLVADELNVKDVQLSNDLETWATFALRPDGKALGPRLGGDVQQVFGAAKSGDWTSNPDGTVTVGGHTLQPSEYELALNAADGVTAAALPSNDAVVVLDTNTTPELLAEGQARDVVRQVQEARKLADLQITDRIDLFLAAPAAIIDAVETHRSYVADQVLATSIRLGEIPADMTAHDVDIDGHTVAVAVRVAD